jgi:hypothetical protein
LPDDFPDDFQIVQAEQQQGIASQQSLFLGPNPEISGGVKMKAKAKRKPKKTEKPKEPVTKVPGGYMNKTELAFRLNRCERTIERWMRDGLVPHLKVGRSVYFKWDMVDQAISQKCLINN